MYLVTKNLEVFKFVYRSANRHELRVLDNKDKNYLASVDEFYPKVFVSETQATDFIKIINEADNSFKYWHDVLPTNDEILIGESVTVLE